MKRFSDTIRPFSLVLVFLMPLAIESALLAEVTPEVLIAEESSKETAIDEIDRLEKEIKKAEEAGLYDEAIALLNEILVLEKKHLGEGHIYLGGTLARMGELYKEMEQYDKAEPLLLKALEIYEKSLGPEHPDTAIRMNNLAELYFFQGLYNKAEPLYLRALTIAEKNLDKDYLTAAFALSDLGNIYLYQGLYQLAEKTLSRSLALREKAVEKNEYANYLISKDLNDLGDVYVSLNKYIEAETVLLRSLALREKILGLNDPITVDTLVDLGNLYSEQGLYNKSERFLLRALAFREKTLEPNHYKIGELLNTLGVLYTRQGSHSKGESFYLRAISIYKNTEKLNQSLGNDLTYMYGKVIGNLGTNYLRQGLYSKAEPLLKRSLKIKEDQYGSEGLEVAGPLSNLGLLYSSKGLYSKAESLLKRSLKISEINLGQNNREISYRLTNLAQLYEDQGLFHKAAKLLERGLKIEFLFIQSETPYLALSQRQSFLQSLGRDYESSFPFAFRENYGRKLALFTRLNRQGLLEEIEKKQAMFSALLAGPQQKIVEEIREINRDLATNSLKDSRRQDLKKRKEELEKKLYRLLPEIKPRIVEVNQVAQAIPSNGFLIEYQRYHKFNSKKSELEAWGEPLYLALVLKPNGEITSFDLGLASLIEEKIQQALKASEEGLADAQQLWREVGELVIKPLKESIGDAQTLFISPDAELNRIPFAALSSHKDNQLLGDAVKIRLLTTGRELLDLAKGSKSSKQKPLVVANPAFNIVKTNLTKQEPNQIAINKSQQRSSDLDSFNWDPLPGTAKEGKVISELTNAQLLTKNQATALALQEREAPKILHIASHAYYLPDQKKGENPLLRSGIVLAGANEPETNPKDDGYLTALEVAKVDWQGTELVVISACESGKGDIQSGEGVYGLKRAIAVAGARSSLLSLWKVNDIATADFMEKFYQKLKDGMGRSKALAETQKEFKNHSILRFRHPYYWAAFQLSGDWRPIDF